MKNLKRIITFILLIMIFPTIAHAYTQLVASTQSPIVGSYVYVSINMDYGANQYIKETHLLVTFDNSYLKLEEGVFTKGGSARGEAISENGRVYINKDGTTTSWSSGGVYQMKFRVLKAGQTILRVERNENSSDHNGGLSYFQDNNVIPHENGSTITIVGKDASDSVKLKSLTVEGYRLTPTFNEDRKNYTLVVEPNVDSIYIRAEKGNSYQTIEGDETQKLEYGLNKLRVTVIAQNGDTNVYEIDVTRKDNRTGDVSLKELSVTNTEIKYTEGETNYNAVVSRSIDSVLITARTNDPNASLTGTGKKELGIGDNIFVLNVKSSGGKEEEYTIKIVRSTEEFQSQVQSNKLLSLKVNGLVLDLSGGKTDFLVGIPNSESSLAISPVTESQTATYEINGNENLKEGLNLVTITVKETDDSESKYSLVVYRNPNAEVINSIGAGTYTTNSLYATTTVDSKISVDVLEKITNNGTSLYYNVVNMYSGLLYQIELKENLIEELDPTITKTSSNPLTYSSNIPAGNNILIYLDGVYKDGNTIKIYSYNQNGSYKLVTAGIKVEHGYVKFQSDGSKFYVFTTATLIKEENPISLFIKNNKTIIFGVVGILVVILLLIVLINKKKNSVEKNEPLY